VRASQFKIRRRGKPGSAPHKEATVDGEDVVQSDSAQGRRAFLKRMAALAFAAPVISSFILDSDAVAEGHDQHGKYPPNQYGQNQIKVDKYQPHP
jgi:hypothetical protein